jgi:3-oxoacyl-[acyl-carrier protein] reductase
MKIAAWENGRLANIAAVRAQGGGMRWENETAIVTGGARGLGRATALHLARRGAAVCVNFSSRPDAAEEVASQIRALGGRAMVFQADVADAAAVAGMVRATEAELGSLTILVNNAGIGWQGNLETFDAARVARMRDVNVAGVIHTIRAAMGGMKSRGYGRIINVSSIAGIGTSLPGNAFYAATKAEVMVLTRRFAMELGEFGITVNSVAPGFVRTDMTLGARGKDDWAAIEQRLASLAIMRRIGEPDDIARAVAFFAAPEAGWITAQILTVDGGRMDYIGHA